MHEFVVWLAGTTGSAALRTSDAALAWVESFHIFSIAVFVGTLAMVDFRLLGWSFRNVLVSEMTSRVLPWSIGAFSVVVTSGVLLFYASPVRAFHSVWFRLKVLLLLAGLVNAALFHYRVSRDRQRWDYARPPIRARFAAGVSLTAWCLVIVCGRLIEYQWFDCERPQSYFVIWLAGCLAYE